MSFVKEKKVKLQFIVLLTTIISWNRYLLFRIQQTGKARNDFRGRCWLKGYKKDQKCILKVQIY